MPEVLRRGDGITDPEQYRKDKEEFANTLDTIFEAEDGKSDEELTTLMDKDLGKDPDKAGDATRDSEQNPDDQLSSGLDSAGTTGDNDDGQNSSSATDKDDSGVDWKQRALTAEAEMEKMNQKMKSWDGRIKAANKARKAAEDRLAEIESKSVSEEDASDAEKIAKFKDEFPELAEVLDIQQRKIDRLQSTSKAPEAAAENADEEFDGSVDDDNTDGNDEAPNDHYVATRKAHPDLDEIVSQGVLKTWINKQPAYIKPHLMKVYQEGNSEQVIDMVTEFKRKTGWKSQLSDGDKTKNDKLAAMTTVDSDSSGPGDHLNGPNKNDFDGAAKEAFKE